MMTKFSVAALIASTAAATALAQYGSYGRGGYASSSYGLPYGVSRSYGSYGRSSPSKLSGYGIDKRYSL